ncbi:MAG: radical SAM family heme chaperone HemW [Streptococcaceae bacterium]|jgi:oxygen-independent coproporphyrinogen-3 oxidase|nr:radical SAM family heme chaperone HemW [Streptococcaceae bacterium]
MSAKAAYVHIPFCSQICYYCDFAKVLLEGQPVNDYLTALLAEWESYDIQDLRTLYIGGGTPTTLTPKQMKRLLDGLTAHLDLSNLTEFTVEANPSDLTSELLRVLAESPVNRISLGVQTFDDALLKRIGRNHTSEEALSALTKLRTAGFANISMDLIYGLPRQTMDQVKSDVEKFLTLDLPHVSLYSLILEDHTRFMQLERAGKLHLPDDDRVADMYDYILSELTAAGYAHYEISNFAKPDYESRHNLTYWANAEYYGIGAGASGYLDGVRYKNHGPIQHYINAVDKKVSSEILSKNEIMSEEMWLGLRRASGVSVRNFEEKFSVKFDDVFPKVLSDLTKTDLVRFDGDNLALSERGFMLGNEVFQKFLLDDEAPL